MSSKKHRRALTNEHNTTHESKKVKRNDLDMEREIIRTCRAFGFTKQEIDDSVLFRALRPYATTAQWIFMTILSRKLVDDSSNLDYVLFREAFDTYPGSSLQIQLHTLMDNATEYNIKRLKGESSYRVEVYVRTRQDEFSDAVWASILAFVFFHDTYKSSTDESLTILLRHFWRRTYRNMNIVNEVQLLASHGLSVDDVFHDDIRACWMRGLNSHLDFRNVYVQNNLHRIFTRECQSDSHSNPKVLDALLRYLLKGADDEPADIENLRDETRARKFWDLTCQQISTWISNQLTASEANDDDCRMMEGPMEGPWRAFRSDFCDQHGNVLPQDMDRICYAFQWLSKKIEPYLLDAWQLQATRFVLFNLSTIEQEVMVMWSRNSTLFRPGFAPAVPSNSTLNVLAGISQPMAYDMLDAIFEREDIPRITHRGGKWVYRGMHGFDQISSTVQMASSQFISTTYMRHVATSFSTRRDSTQGLLLKIWLPPGTPFILLDAFNNTEHEILLPRNHTLQPYVRGGFKEKNTAHFRFVYKRVDGQSSVNEVTTMLERNLSLRSNQRQVVQQQRDILREQLRVTRIRHDDGRSVVFTCRILQYLRYGRKLFAMTFEEQMKDILGFLEKEQKQEHEPETLSRVTQLISTITNESWFILFEANVDMSSMGLYLKTNDTNFWPLCTFYPQNLPGLCVQIASNFQSWLLVKSDVEQKFQSTFTETLRQYTRWWQQSPPTFAIDKASIPRTREEWRHVFRQAQSMSAFKSIDVHTLLSTVVDNQTLLDSLVS